MSVLIPGDRPRARTFNEIVAQIPLALRLSAAVESCITTGANRRAERRREQREQRKADGRTKREQRPAVVRAPGKPLSKAEIRRFKRLAGKIPDERTLLTIYASTEPAERTTFLRQVAPHLRFRLSPGLQRMVDGYESDAG